MKVSTYETCIMKNILSYILIVELMLIRFCFAETYPDPDEVHLNNLNFCKITEQAANNYEPAEFAKSNNLLRRPGQQAIFCGERVIIHGTVLDQNCVPVPDAKIYIWQVDCGGNYPYKPLKNSIDKELVNINTEMTFIGHGTATTNNKGEFHFITIYPKSVHELRPHVNIRVEHHRVGQTQVRLSLYGKKVTDLFVDPELSRIAPIAQEMGSSVYNFEIVMPGSGLNYY